ncbi:MAG: DUF1801 domain-containing protein [Gracilimonas sp.]
MVKSKSSENYFADLKKWKKELTHLRSMVSNTEMEETLKWGIPVYTISGKNVVGLAGFKHHFGIWFYKGALINDPDGHLHNAQEGKTKAMRQLRFTSFDEIDVKVLMDFVKQAIQNQKEGKEVKIDLNREAEIPAFLKKAFAVDKELRSDFHQLTPGRQREYAEYIATAKKDATKEHRLEKIIPMIKSGVGLNDKYQK